MASMNTNSKSKAHKKDKLNMSSKSLEAANATKSSKSSKSSNDLKDSKTSKTEKEKFNLTEFLFDTVVDGIPSGNFTLVTAFLLPFVILLALYFLRDIFPFGGNVYLKIDMYHQYAPFYAELAYKLKHGESLLYTWDIGMGTNFVSLMAYYLVSPINLLLLIFPQRYVVQLMDAFITLKIAGSSLTCAYYISSHFKTKKFTVAFFGLFYAFSGYIAAYAWNIMWLDCVLLFPLIILGLERLVNEGKCVLYTVSLGLCILSNYYISIMVVGAVIIYYLILNLAYDCKGKKIKYIKNFGRWALYSGISGGFAACLILPEIYTFSLSASADHKFPKTLEVYFSVMETLIRHLAYVPTELGLDHFPNIYCGVAVLILIPLYIFATDVKPLEKFGKLLLLIFCILSYNLNILDYICHGLHFPNSLPARHSFIYIFFVLIMAYEGFTHLRNVSKQALIASVLFPAILLVLAEPEFFSADKYNYKVFYYSGGFLLLYSIIFFFYRTRKIASNILLYATLFIVIIESSLNALNSNWDTTDFNDYILDYNAVASVTDTVYENDPSFYRMDKVYGARTKNDGAWHNYNSMSVFSSTCNDGVRKLYQNLGMIGDTNYYGYEGSTLVTDMLFSVKYRISNEVLASSSLSKFTAGSDGEFIYQNQYCLPIGYVTKFDNDKSIISDMYLGIDNQNKLVNKLTGVSNVFKLMYRYPYENDVTFSPTINGHVYIDYTNTDVDLIGAIINGESYSFQDLSTNPHVIDLGFLTTSDQVNISCETNMGLSVYVLDESAFTEAYNILNKNSFNVESYSTTKFTGSVNADNDGNFLFSIPYDKGWRVEIDGKKVSTFAYQNALLACNITAGQHKVKISYVPVNLIFGCLISISCIIIMYLITRYKNKLDSKIEEAYLKILEKKASSPSTSEEKVDEILNSLDDFDNIDNSDDETNEEK